eukprot:6210818-Pleurochrysis_carterae.AAC.3
MTLRRKNKINSSSSCSALAFTLRYGNTTIYDWFQPQRETTPDKGRRCLIAPRQPVTLTCFSRIQQVVAVNMAPFGHPYGLFHLNCPPCPVCLPGPSFALGYNQSYVHAAYRCALADATWQMQAAARAARSLWPKCACTAICSETILRFKKGEIPPKTC